MVHLNKIPLTMVIKSKQMVLPYLFILLSFVADRLSKEWAAGYLAEYGTTQLNWLITLTPTHNRGIVFGLLQGIGPFVGWLSVVIVLVLFVYLVYAPRSMWLLRYGLALIIGGSLGNLVDRVIAGQVLDFIQTPIRSGVFNVADVLIHLGLGALFAGFIFQKEERNIELDGAAEPHKKIAA
jgi:signal peptidase II